MPQLLRSLNNHHTQGLSSLNQGYNGVQFVENYFNTNYSYYFAHSLEMQ